MGGMPPRNETSVGPVIGIVIIVIIIILGGLYFWGSRVNDTMINDEALIDSLSVQGTSDEIADIDADLVGTNLEGLDADLSSIDTELGQ